MIKEGKLNNIDNMWKQKEGIGDRGKGTVGQENKHGNNGFRWFKI